MFPKIFIFGTLLFLVFYQESFGLEIKVVKTLYQVVPRNQEQLDKLYELEWNHPEILVWSGIVNLGDAVQLLANSKDMDQYRRKTLDKVGLDVTIEFPTVNIIMQDNNKVISNDSIAKIPSRRMRVLSETTETQYSVNMTDSTGNLRDIHEWIACHSMQISFPLNAEIFEYKFPETPESMLEQHRQGSDAVIFKKTIPNNSAASARVEVKQTYSRTSEFSWGLEENLSLFASVTATTGVPFVAQGEVSTGTEVSVGSNQQWTESNTKTYEIAESVEVPPYTTVEMTAYTQAITDLPLPFTAEMRVKLYDAAFRDDIQGHNSCVMIQLKKIGYTDVERLSGDNERGVRIRVNGNFKGTFGFIGFLAIDDVTKKSSKFNRYDQKRSKMAMCNRIR